MPIQIELAQLSPPLMEFGAPGTYDNPKTGLLEAGPFDLRFGAAHKTQVRVGLVGTDEMIKKGTQWLERCCNAIPSEIKGTTQYMDFPGFEPVFRAALVLNERWTVGIDAAKLNAALKMNTRNRFEEVLDLYAHSVKKLADDTEMPPDIVIVCLPDDVVQTCWSISTSLTPRQRQLLKKRQAERERGQLSLFDFEENEDDLLNRDFRRALKARAMECRMPIQIGRNNLFTELDTNQDAATRAWNMSVALYYKAGGIPWRMKTDGPETCLVGISFHHQRTLGQHFAYASLAQAFSTRGDGFAIRGEAMPPDERQGRKVHLTASQAAELGKRVLEEYRERSGGTPQRIVLHKTTQFDEPEQEGFRHAFQNVPIVELINIMPTQFRLLKYGKYPPRRGTLCTVNKISTYLFLTGYMPEWRTYPGPHIPAPVKLVSNDDVDMHRVAKDILGLARMNWNTASISSAQPVTLSFSRRVGGIMKEVGSDREPHPSFRYYI